MAGFRPFIGHNARNWQPTIAALVDHLAGTPPEGAVTYGELSRVAQMPIGSTSHPLRAALRRLLHERGIVFRNEVGVGYRRCDDAATVGEVRRGVRRVWRASKRALAKGATVNEARLSPSQRVQHWGQMFKLGTIARSAHGNALNAEVRRREASLVEAERAALAQQFLPAPAE